MMRRRSTRIWQRMTALVLTMAMLCTLAPTAWAEDVQPGPSFSATPGEVDFGSFAKGYEVGEGGGKVNPVSITVVDTGTLQGPKTLEVALVGSNTKNFTVSTASIATTNVSQSQYQPSILIQPVADLSEGEYHTQLLIAETAEHGGIGITVNVSFIVTESVDDPTPPPEPSFVAVTNITDVPTTMTAGSRLALTGTVVPSNATNKIIAWFMLDAGSTGASLTSDSLFAPSPGTVQVKASIANGSQNNQTYEKIFDITVTDNNTPPPTPPPEPCLLYTSRLS